MTQLTGDGEYVNVYSSEEHPDDVDAGFIGGTNWLAKRFELTDWLVGTLANDLDDRLNSLSTYLTTALPAGWQDILDITIPNPDPIDYGTRPTLRKLVLDYDWPSVVPTMGALTDIPTDDFSFTAPVKPPDENPSLDYTASPYFSPMWDALFDAIYDGVVNGGTGLNAATEAAIFARGTDRQEVAAAAEYQKLIDASSADGFDFAGGAQASLLLSFANRRIQEATNLSNDIIKISADLAQNNTQFMLTQGTAIEEMLRKFYQDDERRIFEAKKAVADFIIAKLEAKVRLYVAEWEGIKAEIEAKIARINGAKAYNDAIIAAFRGAMDGYVAQVDATAKMIDGEVKVFQGEVDGFTAEMQERAAWWNALTEEQRTQMQKYELEVRLAIAEVEALLKSTSDFDALKAKIVEGMAGVIAQVLASALGSINASLGHQTQKQESLSEQWQHSDSIDESHRFDETAT